jgi:signal transduction histidine kinase
MKFSAFGLADRVKAVKHIAARHVRPALFMGLLLWVMMASVLAVALERERRQALAHAKEELATLSAVVKETTGRTFDGVDIALSGISDQLAAQEFSDHDNGVRQLMRNRLRQLPTVRALFVIGPEGWIQHDTDYPNTPKVSLADREYFKQYTDDPRLEHALSPALQSRSGTGWFIASTRRITGSDGKFKGIVVAAVQLDWVSRLFTNLHLQPSQTLSLLQHDGRLLARYPRDDRLVGRSYAQHPVFAQGIPSTQSGVFETGGPPLGYPRIVGYGALETQPLVVVLTIPRGTVLAAWYRTVAGAMVAMVVFTLLTALGVMFFVQREAERQRAVAHRLAQAEAVAAAEANAKFRTFFEQGSSFSCVLALDGSVLETNDAGVYARAIDHQRGVGEKIWECDWWGGGGPIAGMRDAVAAAAGGATVRTEAAYRLEGGSLALLELAFSPIRDSAGAVFAVAALGLDVTQRKHQEERLRVLAGELANADRRKGEFLATLSHELRNVLAPLQNGVSILERVAPGTAPALRAQEMIKRQVFQMRRLVDDLLDVSRVNSGKVRIEKEHTDLCEVLATTADAARSIMDAHRHRFTTSWADEPLYVDVDRARMQQVFMNLLGNAAKYTPPDGQIVLRARREGGEIVVDVIDNGMGIPIEAQATVFEMFEQVSENLARAQGGLGIGLSLVQKLVTLHGGHVEAFSEGANRGSTFTVYLPLADGFVQPDAAAVDNGGDA